MKKELVEKLNYRNNRIIEAVKKKAQKVCPGSIALIGIGGSFCSGDIYEKSDLDLFIVINDNDGWKIGTCFILEDVAHDIYCNPWSTLENMAEYNDPFITKLLDLKIVYCADDKYMEKYLSLRNKVTEILNKPFNINDLNKVKVHLDMLLKTYALIMIEDDYSTCKYYSAKSLTTMGYIMYMVNKTYVKRGIKRIPEEIFSLKKQPDEFEKYFTRLVKADTAESIKENLTILVKKNNNFIKDLEKTLEQKKAITKDKLRGTYEEIYSNWKNKMYYAAEHNDDYLSFMTCESCQEFYDEFYDEFDIKRVDLMKNFNINDLYESAEVFDDAMEEYRGLYKEHNLEVKHYKNIDEFEEDYIR